MDFISLRKMPLSHVTAINSFRERLIVCYRTLFFHIALSMHTDISNWLLQEITMESEITE